MTFILLLRSHHGAASIFVKVRNFLADVLVVVGGGGFCLRDIEKNGFNFESPFCLLDHELIQLIRWFYSFA